MAARKRKDRRRRRRGRFGPLYLVLSVLLILAAIAAACVAFFRVNQVTVSGNQRYTMEEVVAASEVKAGDNLFLLNRPQVARNITKALSYVENVTPVIRLPDTLELRVTENTAVAVLESGDLFWVIDARGKLLESGDRSIAPALPLVLGLTPLEPEVGDQMAVLEEEQLRLSNFNAMLKALDGVGLTRQLTDFVDLRAPANIYFGFGGELTVAVSAAADFPEQAFRFQRVLETFAKQGETVRGTLDLTYEGKQARLLSSRWVPDGWEPYVPPVEPEPSENPDLPVESGAPTQPEPPAVEPEKPDQPEPPAVEPEKPDQPEPPAVEPVKPDQPDSPEVKPEKPDQAESVTPEKTD